jgi:hypothetical protein
MGDIHHLLRDMDLDMNPMEGIVLCDLWMTTETFETESAKETVP